MWNTSLWYHVNFAHLAFNGNTYFFSGIFIALGSREYQLVLCFWLYFAINSLALLSTYAKFCIVSLSKFCWKKVLSDCTQKEVTMC